MPNITLTNDQENAYRAFTKFITNPTQSTFVLSGYSGTGKSTLFKYLLNNLNNFNKMAKLIDPTYKPMPVILTATTNKAAESLASIVKSDVRTIHSVLGLIVQRNWKTGETLLVPKRKRTIISDALIVVDEAGKLNDRDLVQLNKGTLNCKFILIGDPAQLAPVKSNSTPAFDSGFPEARLEEVVRQDPDNQIIELGVLLRDTVKTGVFPDFVPDGKTIIHLPRDEFNTTLLNDMKDPSWDFNTSKFLAWTNKRVMEYNKAISDAISGDPNLKEGDYAICNNYIKHYTHNINFKTDQLVHITGIGNPVQELGVMGRYYAIDGKVSFFCPDSISEKNRRYSYAKANSQHLDMQTIDECWIDLRAAYACTIDKAMGSTYTRAYIDLDDIKKCNNKNQVARMLYVAVTRPSEQVFLTGDFL